MPAYERARLTAEFTAPDRAERLKEAVAGMELVREGGPQSVILSGKDVEVLDAARDLLGAALEAGIEAVDVHIEVEGDAERFDGGAV